MTTIDNLKRYQQVSERAHDDALSFDYGADIECSLKNNAETAKQLISEREKTVNPFNNYIEGLNERNCNYRLKQLWLRRESIARQEHDAFDMSDTKFIKELNEEYQRIVDTEEILCAFRRTHNCATEGDEEYERS